MRVNVSVRVRVRARVRVRLAPPARAARLMPASPPPSPCSAHDPTSAQVRSLSAWHATAHVNGAWSHVTKLTLRPLSHSQNPLAPRETTCVHALSRSDSRSPCGSQPAVCRHAMHPSLLGDWPADGEVSRSHSMRQTIGSWSHVTRLALRPPAHSQYPLASRGTITEQSRSAAGSRGPSGSQPPVCRQLLHVCACAVERSARLTTRERPTRALVIGGGEGGGEAAQFADKHASRLDALCWRTSHGTSTGRPA